MQKVEIKKHTTYLEAILTENKIKRITDGAAVTKKTKDVDGNLLAEEVDTRKRFFPPPVPVSLMLWLNSW